MVCGLAAECMDYTINDVAWEQNTAIYFIIIGRTVVVL